MVSRQHRSPVEGRGCAVSSAMSCALAGLWLLAPSPACAQSLQDFFTNRVTITSTSGSIFTNNSAATVEPGEPKHGGKIGGHSMWITWVAPTNGVAKFETEGSRFDTLLSVYRFASTNDTTFDKLIPVAVADDSEGFGRESELEFGALAGQSYEIAVDGYFGDSGSLELNWSFLPTTVAPPVVLSTPPDRAVQVGESVALAVALSNVVSAQFKWFFNGNELGITSTNLVIPSFQTTNVGRYKMRIRVSGQDYFVMPTELQINSDGESNALARGKVLDAPDTPLIGTNSANSGPVRIAAFRPMGAGPSGIVRGYNGSQIFNTAYATADPNEPPHCGISGGASYWLIYQPPANGTITLDTIGSAYDTVMEAYTYNGTLTGYADLISIACDNDSVAPKGAARIQFPVVKSRQYAVVVEGVNGATGTAWLNYSLNTNQPPTAPTLLEPPTTVVVAQGKPAVIAPTLAGAPPLCFSWKKNTTPLPGMTAPGLFFSTTSTNDSANYVVTVTNDLGTLSATLPLRVVIPMQCALARTSTWLQLSFPTISGQRYTVEEASAVTGPWQAWPNFYIGDGRPMVLNVPGDGTRFYRVRIE